MSTTMVKNIFPSKQVTKRVVQRFLRARQSQPRTSQQNTHINHSKRATRGLYFSAATMPHPPLRWCIRRCQHGRRRRPRPPSQCRAVLAAHSDCCCITVIDTVIGRRGNRLQPPNAGNCKNSILGFCFVSHSG